MLTSPETRYSAEQVLAHDWVINLAPNSSDSILKLDINNLIQYNKSNKFKRAVLTFIASRLKDEDVLVLKDIFNSLDINNDGTLTFNDIKEGLAILPAGKKLNFSEIYKSIDTNQSGSVNYTEFIAAAMDPNIYLKEDRLYEAFKVFDRDNSGKISFNEIKEILKGEDFEIGNIKNILQEFDSNNDGEIDYNEFIMMMSKFSA